MLVAETETIEKLGEETMLKRISRITSVFFGVVLKTEKVSMRCRGQGGCALAVLLIACLLFSTTSSHAKEWDFDRGQYRSDAEIAGLSGPVREVVERDSSGNKPSTGTLKTSYDPNGNVILMESVSYDNNLCSDTSYTYDVSGHLLADSYSLGQSVAGDTSCHNLKFEWSHAYSYTFNTQGDMTMQTMTSAPPPSQPNVFKYSYDSQGRLVRMDETSGSGSAYEDLSYAADPRGLRVTRHHYSSNNGLVFDVVRTLIYSSDGRLLQVTQVPSDVFGFGGGDGVIVYSENGRRIRVESGKYNTSYSQYDRYGNWTESLGSNGGTDVRLEIKYWANSL